jgi:hypothetical protein
VNSPNWDDEAVLEEWCAQQRAVAAEYLSRQPVRFGELGEWPAWDVAPYVAVWAVESVAAPGKVGWWVITGDLPTDYVSGAHTPDPRTAVAAIAARWSAAATVMERGEQPVDITVGNADNAAELGPLLGARARTLASWANDDSVWDE